MNNSNQQNQPVITEDKNLKSSWSQRQNKNQMNDQAKARISLQEVIQRHPECVPVYFVKHQKCPKDFPNPTVPFMLFSKQLKIEQAMYNLYRQINIKGLYFFCHYFNEKAKKVKYAQLQPGQTIEQIFKKYGKNNVLTLIYGDKNIGMEGVNKVQKWLIRILIVLAIIWGLLTVYPYFLYYSGLADQYYRSSQNNTSIDNNFQKANIFQVEQQSETILEIHSDQPQQMAFDQKIQTKTDKTFQKPPSQQGEIQL